MEIISILFKTKENANYFPEPRLYSFVAAQFKTSLPQHGCTLQAAIMFGFFKIIIRMLLGNVMATHPRAIHGFLRVWCLYAHFRYILKFSPKQKASSRSSGK